VEDGVRRFWGEWIDRGEEGSPGEGVGSGGVGVEPRRGGSDWMVIGVDCGKIGPRPVKREWVLKKGKGGGIHETPPFSL